MLLLVDHEIKFIGDERHFALIVLDIIVLHLLEELLHARLAEELNERLIFRIALECTEEQHSAVFFVTGCNKLLRLVKQLVHKGFLRRIKPFNIWLELHELLVFALRHRTRNDQRSTGIVYEHRVHLVDNGEMVLALHKVAHGNGHIVTKVIETELIVCSEGDVACIRLLAGLAVGLMLVDAVHAQSVEHIERSHPLGVTL